MKFFFFWFVLFIGIELSSADTCSTINDCPIGVQSCLSGTCDYCSKNSDCSSQHSKRKTCRGFFGLEFCVECLTNDQCTEGKTCVQSIANWAFLCAMPCSSPTDDCGPDAQCIAVSSTAFYCLSCETDSDCKNWSGGDPSSTCSTGLCSPTSLSCGQHGHCISVTMSACINRVCSPCTSSSHCAHLPGTPVCDNGVRVQCADHSDCPSGALAKCSANVV